MWWLPEKDIRARVRKLVQDVKENAKVTGGLRYTDPNDQVARSLNIQVTHAPLPNRYGLYIESENPRIILDTTKQGSEKLNFTYFHEITHHIIHGDGEILSWISQSNDIPYTLERFCDLGASEFITPISEIKNFILSQGFTVSILPSLDQIFPASKPAILHQIIECAQHKCIAVICAPSSQYTPNETPIINPLGLQLSIEQSIPSWSTKYKISRQSNINDSDVVYNSYVTQSHITGKSRFPSKSQQAWMLDCDSIGYKGKVYSIFNIESPPQIDALQLPMDLV